MAEITVVGCGAVGSVMAGLLIDNGHDVEIVSRNKDILKSVNRRGIILKGALGKRNIPARCLSAFAPDRPARKIIILATKADDCVAAMEQAEPYLSADGCVVTTQNGVVMNRVASVVGRERVIGGVINWGASQIAPGIVDVTSRGYMVVGADNPRAFAKTEHLRSILSVVYPTHVSENIEGVLWSKLIVNAGFNPVCALLDCTLGNLLRSCDLLAPAFQAMNEGVRVANRKGIVLEKIFGLELERILVDEPADLGVWRRLILQAVGFRLRNVRPSMLQSLARGCRTEIRHINGFLVQKGERAGIDVPMNRLLVRLIEEAEINERGPGRHNLSNLRVERPHLMTA